MTDRDYVFKVLEAHVVDGDTFDVRLEHLSEVDVGFHLHVEHRSLVKIRIRLAGFDTPEKRRGSVYEKGQAKVAQRFAQEWLAAHVGTLWVRTLPDDGSVVPDGEFGRWLGDIWSTNGGEAHLGPILAGNGLATVWPARWREVYDKQGSDR